jgi:hypothetical protein
MDLLLEGGRSEPIERQNAPRRNHREERSGLARNRALHSHDLNARNTVIACRSRLMPSSARRPADEEERR